MHLRRGQGARSNDVVICASCIEKGEGLDLLDAAPALVGADKAPALAGANALNEVRDRAKTALASGLVTTVLLRMLDLVKTQKAPLNDVSGDDALADENLQQELEPGAPVQVAVTNEHQSDDIQLEDDSSALEPSADEDVDLAEDDENEIDQLDDLQEDLVDDSETGSELLDDAEEVDPETTAQADATGRIEASSQADDPAVEPEVVTGAITAAHHKDSEDLESADGDDFEVEADAEQSDQTDMYSPEQVAAMRQQAGVEEEEGSSAALEAVKKPSARSGRNKASKARKGAGRGTGKSTSKSGRSSSAKSVVANLPVNHQAKVHEVPLALRQQEVIKML